MINVNQQALLELLKASLFGTDPSFPIDTDWNEVLQEAEDQTVVALAAPAIPDSEAEKWEKRIRYNKMRFMQILTEQTNLIRVFHDAGIPLVILKGCAAAMYYPEPVRRTMGDIDFIVPPEQFDDARHLMEENGYQFDHDLGDDRDYCFYKNKVTIWRCIISKTLANVIINIFLNTLWLSILMGKGFYALLGPRITKNLIALPIEIILLWLILGQLAYYFRKHPSLLE